MTMPTHDPILMIHMYVCIHDTHVRIYGIHDTDDMQLLLDVTIKKNLNTYINFGDAWDIISKMCNRFLYPSALISTSILLRIGDFVLWSSEVPHTT